MAAVIDDWEYADPIIHEDDEELDDNAQYFDVPLPYRPIQTKGEKKMTMMKNENEIMLKELSDTQVLSAKLMETPHYRKIGAEGIYALVEADLRRPEVMAAIKQSMKWTIATGMK